MNFLNPKKTGEAEVELLRPPVAPVLRHRNKTERFRGKQQSMMDLSSTSPDTSNTELTNNHEPVIKESMGRRFTKFLFRRPNKPRPATDFRPKIIEPVDKWEPLRIGEKGYIGNLGLGTYVPTDEAAFVNCDPHDDSSSPPRSRYTKSLINLTAVVHSMQNGTKEDETNRLGLGYASNQDVSSISSNGHTPPSGYKNYSLTCSPESSLKINKQTPKLIRLFFNINLSTKGSEDAGMDTLTNRKTTHVQLPIEDDLPAWLFLTSHRELQTDTLYTIYRTKDYDTELQDCLHWVEEQLKFHVKRSPSVPRITTDSRSRRITSSGIYVNPMAKDPIKYKLGKSIDFLNSNRDDSPSSSVSSIPSLLVTDLKSIRKFLNASLAQLKSYIPQAEESKIKAWLLRETSDNCMSRDKESQIQLSRKSSIARLDYPEEVLCKADVHVHKIQQTSRLPQDLPALEKFLHYTITVTNGNLLLHESPSSPSENPSTTRFKYVVPLYKVWYDSIDGLENLADGTNEEGTKKASKLKYLLIGYPPADNWILYFPDEEAGTQWTDQFIAALENIQNPLKKKKLYVKVTNANIDCDFVYRYHKISLDTTSNILRREVLHKIKLNEDSPIQLSVKYEYPANEQHEFVLLGPENTLLIALNLTLEFDKASIFTRRSSTGSCGSNQMNPKLPFWDQFVSQIHEKGPILPRKDVLVEFVLSEITASPTPIAIPNESHESRSRVKVDKEEKKSTSVRGQKSKQNKPQKTKSSMFLFPEPSRRSRSAIPMLRGARSAGALGNAEEEEMEIFGQMPEHLWPDATLPQSLVSLFIIVYYLGIEVQGIFRRTGVVRRIEEMRLKVDLNIEQITPENCDALLAGNVLKRYFNEIPHHLLKDQNWSQWIEVSTIESPEERLDKVRELTQNLSTVRKLLLVMLLHLMLRLLEHEDNTLMTANAIGTVWGPNVIQHPDLIVSVRDSKNIGRMFASLLEPRSLTEQLMDELLPNSQENLNKQYAILWERLNNKESKETAEAEESSVSTAARISVDTSNISANDAKILASSQPSGICQPMEAAGFENRFNGRIFQTERKFDTQCLLPHGTEVTKTSDNTSDVPPIPPRGARAGGSLVQMPQPKPFDNNRPNYHETSPPIPPKALMREHLKGRPDGRQGMYEPLNSLRTMQFLQELCQTNAQSDSGSKSSLTYRQERLLEEMCSLEQLNSDGSIGRPQLVLNTSNNPKLDSFTQNPAVLSLGTKNRFSRDYPTDSDESETEQTKHSLSSSGVNKDSSPRSSQTGSVGMAVNSETDSVQSSTDGRAIGTVPECLNSLDEQLAATTEVKNVPAAVNHMNITTTDRPIPRSRKKFQRAPWQS